jgi:DHA1 family multidrug resistance protein-like MFS transporter
MNKNPRNKTGSPSFEKLLFICCAVSFACNLGSYMRIPVVPLFARSLGADTVLVGMINSSFLLTAGLLSLPFGILSDRLGRKVLLLSGLLISSCTSFLLYFCTSPPQMIWIYLFFGIGLAAFNPTMMSYVADISPPTHLGRAYGLYTMALYGGMTLGPALGGFLCHARGFRPVFLISGAFIFFMASPALFFLPRSRHNRSDKPEQKVLSRNGTLFRNRPLLGCWLATLGSCFGYGMFMTFVPLYANNLGMNAGQIGLVFATQALSNALSRIPLGFLSDKVANRGYLAMLGFVIFIASLAGFGISGNLAQFAVCSAVLGIGMGMIFTPLGALISEVVPRESRGLAMGGYNTCIYLGMMLSSAVMGMVIGRVGFERGFFLTALLNTAIAGLFYLAIRNFAVQKETDKG